MALQKRFYCTCIKERHRQSYHLRHFYTCPLAKTPLWSLPPRALIFHGPDLDCLVVDSLYTSVPRSISWTKWNKCCGVQCLCILQIVDLVLEIIKHVFKLVNSAAKFFVSFHNFLQAYTWDKALPIFYNSWITFPAHWFCKLKKPQVGVKLSITLYHIISNILCELDLLKHSSVMIIGGHYVTLCVSNHITYL